MFGGPTLEYATRLLGYSKIGSARYDLQDDVS